jgi:hypothetical protein
LNAQYRFCRHIQYHGMEWTIFTLFPSSNRCNMYFVRSESFHLTRTIIRLHWGFPFNCNSVIFSMYPIFILQNTLNIYDFGMSLFMRGIHRLIVRSIFIDFLDNVSGYIYMESYVYIYLLRNGKYIL